MAVRWCTCCDDPFCGECWHLIHLRGKRQTHAYCEIDIKGNISNRAIGPNGEDAGTFQAGSGGRGYGSDYAGETNARIPSHRGGGVRRVTEYVCCLAWSQVMMPMIVIMEGLKRWESTLPFRTGANTWMIMDIHIGEYHSIGTPAHHCHLGLTVDSLLTWPSQV